jgi:hypothetical protein
MPEKTIKVRVDSGNSKQEINELNNSMKNLGAQADKAGGRLGGMSRNAGQAGIQIQQFVGQVQGGQSAMLALSQQAADLGIVLGAPLVGAVVGLSASFAGLLIPSLLEADDALEKYTEAQKEAQKELNSFIESTDQASKNEAILAATSRLNNEYDELQKKIEAARAEQEAITQQIGTASETAVGRLTARFESLNTSIEENEKRQAILSQRIEETFLQGLPEASDKIGEANTRLNAFVNALTVKTETLGLTQRELALYTAQQLGATQADIQAINQKYDLIDAYNLQIDAEKKLLAEKKLAQTFAESVIGRGQSESERFANELVKLDELRAQGLISQQTYDEAIVASVTARADQIEAQNQRTQQLENNYKNILINTAVAALNLTKNNNKKMTKEQKKQAKQSVYINTAAAIARAYGENNFYVASAMAVFLAAMQLRQINAIETASGGGGGDAGAPQIAAQPAQQQQQSSTFEILGLDTLIGELRESNGVLSTDAVANMFESFRQAGQNGANTSLGG